MKSNLNCTKSLYKTYVYITLSVSALIIIVTSVLALTDYQLFKNEKQFLYSQEARKISEDIESNFVMIEEFSRIVGEKISEHGYADPEFIGNTFLKAISIARINKNILALDLFDFVTPDGKVIASTVDGVIINPFIIEKNRRKWMELAPKKPWMLHISHPDRAITNTKDINTFAIPVGYGVTDKNGKFLGTISTGISIEKLYSKIHNSINDNISFVILSKDMKFIASTDLESENLKEKDGYKLFNEQSEGTLRQNILSKGYTYSYFRSLENLPYIILIGEDRRVLHNEFKKRVIPHLVQISLVASLLFILFYIFRRKIISPITELANVTKDISMGKDDINIQDYSTYEMKTLRDQVKKVIEYTTELKQTKEDLELAQEELKLHNQTLENKVQVRTLELEKALAFKTEFLNNMSHEVRTPVQGICGISEGLVDNWPKLSESKRFESMTLIAKSCNRLLSLVGNLLDLSKFDAGMMKLDLKPIDLNVAIDDIIEECTTLYFQEKGTKFKFTHYKNSTIVGDPERVAQILRNIFFNAIKFSPKNSLITTKITSAELILKNGDLTPAIRVSVTDEGIGIPEQDLEIIFDTFTQSSATQKKSGGTGLGLPICRQIVETHGGKIWAENNKNKGSTFHFIMPLTQPGYVPQVVRTTRRKRLMNLLMIDDEQSCLASIEMMLMGTDFNLIKAETGLEALKYMNEHPGGVDVVLLDLMMPDMYGYDVLNAIRKDPELAGIPVIMQSGTSDEAEIQRCFDIGLTGYVKKPYQRKSVLEVLDRFVD